MSEFLNHWRAHYADAPPLSHLLRDARTNIWARFHAPPNAKRYATTANERSEILRRAYAIGKAVLDGTSECWLVQAGSVALGWPEEADHFRGAFGLIHQGDYAEDGAIWPIFAARVRFKAGNFDTLLCDIAEDRAYRTFWMALDGPRVFAPYDGGFDTFSESAETAAALKTRFADWLSDRPDGH